MIYSYIRQVHGLTPLSDQQRDILSFSLTQNIEIDKEVVEYSSRTLKIEERKDFEKFLHSLTNGDSIIVSHLAVLSQYAEELIKVVNCSLSRGIRLYTVHPKRLINIETKLVDLLPLLDDLIETEESKTTQIGRPKGSRSSSKFDKFKSQILSKLKEGCNVSAISRELGVSRSSLKDYIESRSLREIAAGAWVEVQSHSDDEATESRVLICPFEKEKFKKKVS
ncbi:MAG TPA: hypothetical protein ENK72_00625 [Epsilonproteobacteria bacterium]|nr:hypothetical protein [Campylobacterota bacterium]